MILQKNELSYNNSVIKRTDNIEIKINDQIKTKE